MTFDGAAERVSSSDTGSRLVGAGPTEVVRLQLDFVARTPVFDFMAAAGLVENVGGSTTHHQQAFSATGWVEVSGERHDLDGLGYRDHSVGPRNLGGGGFGGSSMVFAGFDDGAIMMARQTTDCGGQVVARGRIGYVFENGRFRLLAMEDITGLLSTTGAPSQLECAASTAIGRSGWWERLPTTRR